MKYKVLADPKSNGFKPKNEGLVVEIDAPPEKEEQFVEELSKKGAVPKNTRGICLFDDELPNILVSRCSDEEGPQDDFSVVLQPLEVA